MSIATVRNRRKLREYRVSYNAGLNGHATKIRFSPNDRWVGNDYWHFVGERTPSRKERALTLMIKLEAAGRQQDYIYWLARAVAYREMGCTQIADRHLEKWREEHGR